MSLLRALGSPPAIVHHMAALDGSLYPQNSLEAVRASLEAGAAVIEVDITALADSDYLLAHDPALESETSGAGPVRRSATEAVRPLAIRARSGLTPYRVALLSDVVQAFLDFGGTAQLQLDFKDVVPFTDAEPLERLIRLIEPLGERVIVSSGADWQLRKLRRLADWLRLGFDVQNYLDSQPGSSHVGNVALPRLEGAYGYWDDHPLATARHLPTADYLAERCEAFVGLVPDLSVFYLSYRLIVQSLRDGFNWADALHRHGIALDAWTMDADKPAAVEALSALVNAGVDLITTNTPLAMRSLLEAARTAG